MAKGGPIPSLLGFLLALVAGANADMLNLKTGKLLKGTLREVTFAAGGVESRHERDQLQRIELSKDSDKLTLDQQMTLEGRLVTVSFESSDGLHIVARDQLRAIVLDDSTTLAMLGGKSRPEALVIENKRPGEEGSDEAELSEEQRQALKLNLQLYKQYLAKAQGREDSERAAVKGKYMPRVKQVLGQIASLQRRIAEKEQRRREAKLRDALYRQAERKDDKNRKRRKGGDRGHEYERLVRTDGLEEDRRALKEAWARAAKLRDAIRPLVREIDARYEAVKERIREVARLIRDSILQGDIPPREQMVKGYEGALTNPKPRKASTKR